MRRWFGIVGAGLRARPFASSLREGTEPLPYGFYARWSDGVGAVAYNGPGRCG